MTQLIRKLLTHKLHHKLSWSQKRKGKHNPDSFLRGLEWKKDRGKKWASLVKARSTIPKSKEG